MTNLYLSYEQSETGGEICEGQEDESYPNREPAHREFTPLGLYLQRGDWQETIKLDIDKELEVNEAVFLVIVRYTDGDTFGYTTGNWTVDLATTDRGKAERWAQQIREGLGESAYKPWQGYFASLESVDVWCSRIKDEKCPGVRWF